MDTHLLLRRCHLCSISSSSAGDGSGVRQIKKQKKKRKKIKMIKYSNNDKLHGDSPLQPYNQQQQQERQEQQQVLYLICFILIQVFILFSIVIVFFLQYCYAIRSNLSGTAVSTIYPFFIPDILKHEYVKPQNFKYGTTIE